MKFTVKKASRMWYGEIEAEVEVNSIDELREIAKTYTDEKAREYGVIKRVIVDFERNEIVIYDSYLE